VRYLDLDKSNVAAEPSHRCASVSSSDDSFSIKDVSAGSHSVAQKWYEGYRRKDAKLNLKARIFRVWELEHGRRIQDSDARSRRPKQGLKEKLHGFF
jgi:hypothetical protein